MHLAQELVHSIKLIKKPIFAVQYPQCALYFHTWNGCKRIKFKCVVSLVHLTREGSLTFNIEQT